MEIKIQLNGKIETVAESTYLSSLISKHKINPLAVVVEINQNPVEKSAYHTTIISSGDCIEILQFVGGG
jgi:thiamine biosynthesis protein ThiS